VVVPKHKHTIVERNLVRRRIREIGRSVLLPALRNSGAALDVLVRARPEAYGAPFSQLRDELATLVEELCSRGR
jgi:ribonuclease P protein component